MNERDYEAGRRQAWIAMLETCTRELSITGRSEHAWMGERLRTVEVLRQLCTEHGDNDWPDNLDLTDIIEKHLRGYLERASAGRSRARSSRRSPSSW